MKYCFSNEHVGKNNHRNRRGCEFGDGEIKKIVINLKIKKIWTSETSHADENIEKDWEKMEIVEKYNGHQKRYMNKSEGGRTWKYFLCNYDDCNDDHVTTTEKPKTTTKHTTKKPNSSVMASMSLPLLMFTILASIIAL